MKRHTKHFLFVLLTMILLAGLAMFVFAEETQTSGQCGDNVYWDFNENSGELTLFGQGAMWDYTSSNVSPWGSFGLRKSIKTVFINEGISYIGNYSFSSCFNLSEIAFPQSLLSIGENAFYQCYSLSTISIPASVSYIGAQAFYNLFYLDTISIEGMDVELGAQAICEVSMSCTLSKEEFVSRLEYIADEVQRMLDDPDVDYQTVVEYLNEESEKIEEYVDYSTSYIGFLYCKKGSTVETYAKENNIDFELLDSETDLLSGQCGENAFWQYNCSTEVLTISGNGELYSEEYSWDFTIKKIIVQDGITNLPTAMFEGTSVEEVEIADTVISLSGEVFFDCQSLKRAKLGNGIKTIGVEAFRGCYSLEEISFGFGLERICEQAFAYCSQLQRIAFYNGLKYIDDSAFFSCSNLSEIEFSETLETIGENAFAYCGALQDIIIPESVNEVKKAAFKNCSSLESVTVLNANCAIYEDEDTFSHTTSLAGYTNSTAHYFARAFDFNFMPLDADKYASGYCGEAAYWTFDKTAGILTITGAGAMWDYWDELRGEQPWDVFVSEIKIIEISEGITRIGTGAFSFMNLEPDNVYLPSTLESIGESAFAYSWVQSISFPSSLKTIEDYAFLETGLETVDLPSGVEDIGTRAFADGQRLKEVIISETVREIGAGAFSNCYYLPAVSIDEDNPYFIYDENGYLMSKDKSVIYQYFMSRKDVVIQIPQTVSVIKSYSFFDCDDLKLVILPNTVSDIEDAAFYGSDGIRHIVILNPECNINGCYYVLGSYPKNIYGYANSSAEAFAKKHESNKIVFHEILSSDHEHVPTWNLNSGGLVNITCALCNETLATIELEPQPHTHTPTTYTQNSTCTIPGYTITTCSECQEQLDFEVLPLAPHQYGEWVTIKEPTTTEKGLRERTCTVCGVAKEQEDIPMVEVLTAEDEASGIEVFYSEDTYIDNQVQLRVEEDFTGSQYLTQSYTKFDAWNIKTYVNGEEAQPNAPVTVRIPLPAGYDPNNIAVFHVNSETGQTEKISDVRVENGYIVFTATSFSVYIVVDESSVVQSEPQKDPNTCPWCGKVHKGFFQNIIAFFHRIFAKLFGEKY